MRYLRIAYFVALWHKMMIIDWSRFISAGVNTKWKWCCGMCGMSMKVHFSDGPLFHIMQSKLLTLITHYSPSFTLLKKACKIKIPNIYKSGRHFTGPLPTSKINPSKVLHICQQFCCIVVCLIFSVVTGLSFTCLAFVLYFLSFLLTFTPWLILSSVLLSFT